MHGFLLSVPVRIVGMLSLTVPYPMEFYIMNISNLCADILTKYKRIYINGDASKPFLFNQSGFILKV